MNDTGSVIARRIAFLGRELDRMGSAADDVEEDLRLNPIGETCDRIQELRAREGGQQAVIRCDRHAASAARRSWRQAMV